MVYFTCRHGELFPIWCHLGNNLKTVPCPCFSCCPKFSFLQKNHTSEERNCLCEEKTVMTFLGS